MSDAQEPRVKGAFDLPAPGTRCAPGPLPVAGWVFDESGGALAGAFLVVGDRAGVPVRLGLSRPDVGEAYPSVRSAGAAGFAGSVDLRADGAGRVRIALLAAAQGAPYKEVAAVEVMLDAEAPPREGSLRRAAFTIVQNEPVMLPLWLAYYRRYFDAGSLYVLDHDTTDGSTANLTEARRIPVHRHASFDHSWLRSTVEGFQAFLLNSYDVVLFTEVDEFVVADPRTHAGLDAYIEGLSRSAVRCAGFNVVHQADEPPLRFDQPLLAQRRYWHASTQHSKRLMSRIPLRWSEGFHQEHAAPDDPPDPELMLVHLHRIDYDACLARHRSSAARNWNTADLLNGRGFQNRLVEPIAFEEWFRRGPGLESPREFIPDHIRALL